MKEKPEPWTGTTDLPPALEQRKTGQPPSRRSGPPPPSLDLAPTALGECQNSYGKEGRHD